MLEPNTTNPITIKIINEINRLEKSRIRSHLKLEEYKDMRDEIQKYAETRYDTNFRVSHVTINALEGKIANDSTKIELLRSLITISDYRIVKD